MSSLTNEVTNVAPARVTRPTTVIGLDRGTTDLSTLEHDVLAWVEQSIPHSPEIATHIIGGHYVASVAVAVGDEFDALRSASAFGFIVSGLSDLEPDDAVSLMPVSPESTPAGRARDAAVCHLMRLSGRLIRFPGVETITADEVCVADLLASSSIDEVIPLGSRIGNESVVVTNGFIRPTLSGGRTTLVVTPLVGDRFAAFETENPHQCCGGHH